MNSEPDWHCYATVLGGHMKDLPEPHVLKWPNKRGVKRDVRVVLSTWVGVGLGATHYYVRVEEEDNYIWDGERWARPWGGIPDQEGQSFGGQFDNPLQCRDYAKEIITEHFSNGEHEIRWEGLEVEHLYRREGG